ncbi:hypothetical protein MS3_00000228 [Schistosoma haematobium]|uniref:Uncharacterized protein n=1 Tax=Schistosoma haematobium TaxID=6185 RepID=A0A922IPM2_SCHHA|nr:hypothetical protein MS3_00000228 [Schistosoma haematobium]KAH9584493.1 hypothetical protein MS3_00000228 [Schistosoma haematobium]
MSKLYVQYIICTSLLNCLLQASLFIHFCCYPDYFQFASLSSLFQSFEPCARKHPTSNCCYILLIFTNLSNMHHITTITISTAAITTNTTGVNKNTIGENIIEYLSKI